MWNAKLWSISALVLLCAVLSANGQGNTPDKIVVVADAKNWEACEKGTIDLGCKPVIIERKAKEDTVLFVMPCAGTNTTVMLTEVRGQELIKTLTVNVEECPPVFELTGLPNGHYSAQMFGCGLGGRIEVFLKTRE